MPQPFTKLRATGTATQSGLAVVANTERYYVPASSKNAALSHPDLPMPGTVSDEFDNLTVIDRRVSDRVGTPPDDEGYIVEVEYGLPNSPQIQPPPDRDNPQLSEFRVSFGDTTIEVPVIYSKTLSVPPPTTFVGPVAPGDIATAKDWIERPRKVLRPSITMILRVNVQSFDVFTAEAIAAQVGNIHGIGSGGWVFKGGDAQRNKPGDGPDSGPAAITYRWEKQASLPGRPEQLLSGDEVRIGIPPLGVNEVYERVDQFIAPVDEVRPVILPFNPYDGSSQGAWQSLPGVQP